jgi:DNA uptake protein ComE-like DNA-binding protein
MKKSILSIIAVLFFSGLLGVSLGRSADIPSIPGTDSVIDKATGHTESKTDDKKHLVDINSASEKDLAELKGIDQEQAKKIVKNRPYARKDELVSKKVIKQKDYDKIKDEIVARQGTGTISEAADSSKKKK